LKNFSRLVSDKVKSKGSTTYNEVADDLCKELNNDIDSKNIKRRVYDALNVLKAANVITKDKKNIQWRGLPGHQTGISSSTLEKQFHSLEESIQNHKSELHDLITQEKSYQKLIERNKRDNKDCTIENKIYLPFIIINTSADTVIECEVSENRDNYFFNFNNTFQIQDDPEILKRLGMLVEDGPTTTSTTK